MKARTSSLAALLITLSLLLGAAPPTSVGAQPPPPNPDGAPATAPFTEESADQAPNRAHNLRTSFTPEAIRAIPRTYEGDAAPWEGELRPAKVNGHAVDACEAPDVSIAIAEGQARLTWPGAAADVFRGTTPYFTPGQPYKTAVTGPWSDTEGGVGDEGFNYTYLLRTAGCTEPFSRRVGEFDYALTPGPGPVSPEALIDEAIANGTLDPETGLVYKVFAIFGDSRLPSQYRATQTMKFGDRTMVEARVKFSTLSPANQALIQPYLLEPQDPGSWYMVRAQQASGASAAAPWEFFDTANGKVRVWFTDDVPDARNKAQALRDAIDTKIWPALFHIMGREPLTPPNPPNTYGKLPISLLPTLDAYGVTTPYAGCQRTPSSIRLDGSHPIGGDASFGIVQIAAHELMHSFQFAFFVANVANACAEYDWLAEATSSWAEDAIYPRANSERIAPGLPDFIKTPYLSINDRTRSRDYGAYTLPYLLSHTPNFPEDDPKQRIGQIWREVEYLNSIEAVDKVARTVISFYEPGVFWSEFYRALWNRLPTDLYQSTDSLTSGARLSADDPNFSSTRPAAVELNGAQTKTFEMKGELRHSSSRYYHFTFSDPTVRTVYLYDGILTGLRKDTNWINEPGAEGTTGYVPGGPPTVPDPLNPMFTRGASFRALYKVEGQDWQEAQLNTPFGVSFCRDARSERITDLVVILGNTDYGRNYTLQPPGEKPVLQVSNMACWQWTGTVTAQHEGGPNNLAWSTTSNVTLRRGQTPPPYYLFAWPVPGYVLQSGQVNFIMPATTQDGCTRSGSGTWTAAPGSETGSLRTVNGSLSGPWHRAHYVEELFEHEFTYQQQCPNGTTTLPWPVTWWDTYSPDTPDDVFFVSSDGTQLSGTQTTGGDGDRMTWTWSFVAEREP